MADQGRLVALVTGASRGAGRGIARELGVAGATVYVTGRTTGAGPGIDNLPGTIEECAREVDERGGRGIPVRCDHTRDHDVTALFERIRSDYGRLDLLVNNVWGGGFMRTERIEEAFRRAGAAHALDGPGGPKGDDCIHWTCRRGTSKR